MKKMLFVLLSVMFVGFLGVNVYAYEADAYNEVPRISLAELSEQNDQDEMPVVLMDRLPQAEQGITPFSSPGTLWVSLEHGEGTRRRSRVQSNMPGAYHRASAWLTHAPVWAFGTMVTGTYRTITGTSEIRVDSGWSSFAPDAFSGVFAASGSHIWIRD